MGQTWTHPPAKGTILTVRHSGIYPSGKLRHAYYLRVRDEGVSWEQLKLLHLSEQAKLTKQ